MDNKPENPKTESLVDTVSHAEEQSRVAVYGRVLARMPKYISRTMETLRPLAYASEVGESFRKVFPYLVKPLYALSIGYVFLDISIKYYNNKHKNAEFKKWFLLDLSLWHLGASLVLPAVIINRYIHTFAKVLSKRNFSNRVVKFVPTVTALCLIPFIVHPLDHFTDYAMDNTFRKFINYRQFDDEPTHATKEH